VKASLLAVPAVIANELDVADVRPDEAAVNASPVPAVVTFTPVNVATPLTAFTVNVPLSPGTPESVTGAVDDVTVLPKASCNATLGCWANATPATVEADGCVVKANCDVAAGVIANVEDVADVKAPDAAVNVRFVPAVVTLTPVNVATPLTAFTVKVPLSPGTPESVTDAVDDVTVLPRASCTVTIGCWANATPAAVDVDGCVVNANCDAAAGVIANVEDVADVKAPDAAVNVRFVPVVVTLTPVNVARPFTAFTTTVP
jgi:hypothetical protein